MLFISKYYLIIIEDNINNLNIYIYISFILYNIYYIHNNNIIIFFYY